MRKRPVHRAASSICAAALSIFLLGCASRGQVPEAGMATLGPAVDTTDAVNARAGETRPAGTMIHEVRPSGGATLLISIFRSARGGISYDTLAIDSRTRRPLWHRTHAPSDSADVVFTTEAAGIRVRGWVAPQGKSVRRLDRTLAADVQVGKALHWTLPRMPLAEGFERPVRTYSMWNDTVETVTHRVVRSDTVRVSGGRVPVWVVQEDRGAADRFRDMRFVRLRWIDRTQPRILKSHDFPESAPGDGYIATMRGVDTEKQ